MPEPHDSEARHRWDETFRVLVVEDAIDDFAMIRRYLDKAERDNPFRFETQHAVTLAAGREAADATTFDVILLDMYLPDGGGSDPVRSLQNVTPDTAIVVLTGQDDRDVALAALRTGADDYLLKNELTAELLARSLLFSIQRSKHRLAERTAAWEREERLAAGRLQANLLPSTTPRVPGFDLAGIYRPANKIGGDLYDILETGDGRLLCHVADVSGHHLSSALIMAGVRRVIRSLSHRVHDLIELFRIVNEAVCEDTEDFQFVSQFLVRLDPSSSRLEYLGAGHAAYVLRGSGEWERLDSQVAPHGIHPDQPDFAASSTRLEPGEIAVLPTDGFVEGMNADRELWGIDRFEGVVRRHRDRSAADIAKLLMSSLLAFCHPREPVDDCSVVIIRAENA